MLGFMFFAQCIQCFPRSSCFDLGIGIAPRIVFFLADFTGFQLCRFFLSFSEQIVQSAVRGIVEFIERQAHFIINLVYDDGVILQRFQKE